MTRWTRKLEAMGACADAVTWAKTHPSLKTAWEVCERGNWMLWYIGQRTTSLPFHRDRVPLVRVAVACARLALPYTEDARVKHCLDVMDRWCEGTATEEEVRQARSAAAYADATYAAAYADATAYAAAARQKTFAQCADLVRHEFPTPPQPRRVG